MIRLIEWCIALIFSTTLIVAIAQMAPIPTLVILCIVTFIAWLVVAKQAELDDHLQRAAHYDKDVT